MSAEMQPYRHTEVIRVTECESCARTKRVARIIRAIGQRYPSGFPTSWLGMNIE